jgi:hypothetical protein
MKRVKRYTEPSIHPQCGTVHWSLGPNATECPPREEWFTGKVSHGAAKKWDEPKP